MLMNHQENCGIHHKTCAFPQECLIEHLRAKLAAETARADAAERLLDEIESIVTDGGGVSLHTKILNLLTVLLRRRGGRKDGE